MSGQCIQKNNNNNKKKKGLTKKSNVTADVV